MEQAWDNSPCALEQVGVVGAWHSLESDGAGPSPGSVISKLVSLGKARDISGFQGLSLQSTKSIPALCGAYDD